MITKNEQGKLEYHKIPRHWIGRAHVHEVRQVCMYVNMCTYLYIYIYIHRKVIYYIYTKQSRGIGLAALMRTKFGRYLCM